MAMSSVGTNLPQGITKDQLAENWDICNQQYNKPSKRMKLLDGADRGRLWETIGAQFPGYQLKPETNHVSYVKDNLLASIYCVGMAASVLPRSTQDVEAAHKFNRTLETIWDQADVPYYQKLAGERAALLNYGVTQVGWDKNITGGTNNSLYKGGLALKNVDPMHFFRDPYAESLDTAAYCIYWNDYHRSVILKNRLYVNAKTIIDGLTGTPPQVATEKNTDRAKLDDKAKDYFRVIIHWVRTDEGIHAIHTIDNEHILAVEENLAISEFPFAELYCNDPVGDPIGVSEPAKIFANSVVYNIMHSIIATHAYKSQRPPRFLNAQAGLNARVFAKYGNDADKVFVVNGDASKAVHYQEFPQLSPMTVQMLGSLAMDVMNISGIDNRYTGRDTGSIITTGGIEEMLAKVSLRDTPKIVNYERYTRRLTKLVLANLVQFAEKREYVVKDEMSQAYETVEIDYTAIPEDTEFDYSLHISTYLPKNRARLAQAATMIMEKQMQYQYQPELITPEEWLYFQDLPQKDLMLQRMGITRASSTDAEVAQVLFQYADLVQQGVDPNEAMSAVSQTLQQQRTPDMSATPPTVPMSPGGSGGMGGTGGMSL